MRWFSLKVWATCALVSSACSDDGVPLNEQSETDTASSVSATAGETADSGGTSAVTTADPSESGGSTTDPTGNSDTEGTSGPSGSSGGDDGSTGGGSSTGGTTEPECTVAEDCMLVDDCCSCTAIAVGEEAPKCNIMECVVSTCTSLGLETPQVQCNFGSCEVEEVSCDPMQVLCDSLPPKCPKGETPRVVDGCWGACIPFEYCDVVPSCDACGEDEACVESVSLAGPSFTCEPIPPACDGVPSCDCLGEACIEPFDTCEDGIEPKTGSELTCSCIDCA